MTEAKIDRHDCEGCRELRIRTHEESGLDRSDAQGLVMAEDQKQGIDPIAPGRVQECEKCRDDL